MTIKNRHLSVIKKHQVSPNMLRITLGGDELMTFPEGMESGYVKLLLEGGKFKRSYTIRAFRADVLELDLDFVLHGDNGEEGPASTWAANVSSGEKIEIAGPGLVKRISQSEDWYFIVGDMTALPAISVNLETMPRDAQGYAVIEIIEEADKQDIGAPEGMKIVWVINPHPEKANTLLPDAVKALPWLEGKPNVWSACEFSGMQQLRTYFKKEHHVGKDEIYISSYWKIGNSDEGHKKAKMKDKLTKIFN
ncbi:siderophore-interacting protein [Marinomonas transparens]|uniref:Siderophore-interacting protein n=1 Tax=Marinomonas transparens TaxID=2795388 RepID=A0A934JPZ7_9GAMM|nr:siderophore-interacting protein [Marinomonas transparens]MBJ7538543.1 siderophore-interacting protein [Marinomonas transparens]